MLVYYKRIKKLIKKTKKTNKIKKTKLKKIKKKKITKLKERERESSGWHNDNFVWDKTWGRRGCQERWENQFSKGAVFQTLSNKGENYPLMYLLYYPHPHQTPHPPLSLSLSFQFSVKKIIFFRFFLIYFFSVLCIFFLVFLFIYFSILFIFY